VVNVPPETAPPGPESVPVFLKLAIQV